jgi:RNA polymerase sigma factor (sigma-70 family)
MDELDSLLPAIAAGDPDAFGRWVAGVEPLLRARLRPLATRLDAESLLQEVLLRVWSTAPRCRDDGRPHPLLRWALRIQHNLAIDELRKARLQATDPDVLEAELAAQAPSEPMPSDPLLRQLAQACAEKLPPQARAAFLARLQAEGDTPDRELAAQLHMTANTFLQNVTRGRRQLADCLRKQGAELPGGAR